MAPLQLTPTLTFERHEAGFNIFRFKDMSRTSLDKWFETTEREDQQALAENRHIATLIDVTIAGYPTPYAVSIMLRAANTTSPDLKETIALVVKNSTALQFVALTLNRLPARTKQLTRVFTQEKRAIDWIRQRLQEIP